MGHLVVSIESSLFVTHQGHLLRRPASTDEFGTPVDADYAQVSSFRCRLSWEGGFELVSERTGQKPQSRQGRCFVHAAEDVTFRRGDLVAVDEFPDLRFEITFNRLIWDSVGPHHWELDVVQVVG